MADKFSISETRPASLDEYYGGGAPEGIFRWLAEKCQKSDDGTVIIKAWYLGDFYIRFRPKKRTKQEYRKERERDERETKA